MTEIYDRAAKDLAALTFDHENQALAEMAAEGDRISAAIGKAETRLREIAGQLSAILQDRMADKRAAVAVADALLGEADAGQAAATMVKERDLRDEQNALRAGIAELNQRSRENSEAMARLKNAAMGKVMPALRPVIDYLLAEARAAADTIARTYATVAGIQAGARTFQAEAEMLGAALAKLMRSDLIPRRDMLEVPDTVAEMLAPLSGKGLASAGNVPSRVGVPEDNATASIVAAMAARQAVG